MKAVIREYDASFFIEFTPETMEDQVSIARLGLNATKEPLYFGAQVDQDEFYLSIAVGRRKQPKSYIK